MDLVHVEVVVSRIQADVNKRSNSEAIGPRQRHLPVAGPFWVARAL